MIIMMIMIDYHLNMPNHMDGNQPHLAMIIAGPCHWRITGCRGGSSPGGVAPQRSRFGAEPWRNRAQMVKPTLVDWRTNLLG